MLRDKKLDEARRELSALPPANQDAVALVNLVASLRTCTLLLLRAVDDLSTTQTEYVNATRRDLKMVHNILTELDEKMR